MLLRPRQALFVERGLHALKTYGNGLGIAPTGAGKSLMGSAIAAHYAENYDGKILFLQHKDRLVEQNSNTFAQFAPKIRTSIVDGDDKDLGGKVVFAMVPTMARNIEMIHRCNWVAAITDETHHSAAKTYQRIYEALRSSSSACHFAGVTADPRRSDRKKLVGIYDNVFDEITLTELIREGHLVPPVVRVVDEGVAQEMGPIKRSAYDFDDEFTTEILNRRVPNEKIVSTWKEMASDRYTVVFARGKEHGLALVDEFARQGVEARFVYDKSPTIEKDLKDFDDRKYKVIINIYMLTEGWDVQFVSCVVLTAGCSSPPTMRQMIGRGLRIINPRLHPGIYKSNCLVIDFGATIHTHKTLDFDATEAVEVPPDKPMKTCPSCSMKVGKFVKRCPVCEHAFMQIEVRTPPGSVFRETMGDFSLVEIDILQASPFRWERLFNGDVMFCDAFDAWAAAIQLKGEWYSIGGKHKEEASIVVLDARSPSYLRALSSADDYMRVHGDVRSAHKDKRWIFDPATQTQLDWLKKRYNDWDATGITKYQAKCYFTYGVVERSLKKIVKSILNDGITA